MASHLLTVCALRQSRFGVGSLLAAIKLSDAFFPKLLYLADGSTNH